MAKRPDNLSFEQALLELEQIVGNLEQGNLPLEQALKQFERGIHLVRASQQKLTQAEQSVQMLTKDGEGEAQLVDFEPQE
ncbi:exodeoxyribonuclease VII small subunit [Ferrimonas sediminicola]|uniref:Exodeoxyribonuclease 7 small subunit n=1 Tax=Ferrimonas sediminicola TaxID=2569538 RepID=A0A4U1BA05_9GAMM|nr:exodeoxyribonuclease VII small subunit [Ferrimonas sediminicola]TKB46870.1 exodeoxyribonuclease VII small subunit [Ferrimonas sediminicola]